MVPASTALAKVLYSTRPEQNRATLNILKHQVLRLQREPVIPYALGHESIGLLGR